MSFFQTHRLYITFIAGLVIISACIFVIPRSSDTSASHTFTTTEFATTSARATSSDPQRTPTSNPRPFRQSQHAAVVEPLDPPSITDRTTPEVAESEAPQRSATLSISGTTHVVEAQGSVIDAMQTLQATHQITFTGREHSSLGFFVESINGQKNENGHYWMLYVNGTQSAVGASHTTLLPGDSVEWRYK